jgi:uncharacterized protein involved in exopolysaccharide biosynthesis
VIAVVVLVLLVVAGGAAAAVFLPPRLYRSTTSASITGGGASLGFDTDSPGPPSSQPIPVETPGTAEPATDNAQPATSTP